MNTKNKLKPTTSTQSNEQQQSLNEQTTDEVLFNVSDERVFVNKIVWKSKPKSCKNIFEDMQSKVLESFWPKMSEIHSMCTCAPRYDHIMEMSMSDLINKSNKQKKEEKRNQIESKPIAFGESTNTVKGENITSLFSIFR